MLPTLSHNQRKKTSIEIPTLSHNQRKKTSIEITAKIPEGGCETKSYRQANRQTHTNTENTSDRQWGLME